MNQRTHLEQPFVSGEKGQLLEGITQLSSMVGDLLGSTRRRQELEVVGEGDGWVLRETGTEYPVHYRAG